MRREIEESLRKQMDFFGVLGFGPQSYVENYSDYNLVKKNVKSLKSLLEKANHLSKGEDNFEKTSV